MPDASGRFRGQGWSQHKEDAWTRVFGPALADDPAYDEGTDAPSCSDIPSCDGLCCVPTEPAPEVGGDWTNDDFGV